MSVTKRQLTRCTEFGQRSIIPVPVRVQPGLEIRHDDGVVFAPSKPNRRFFRLSCSPPTNTLIKFLRRVHTSLPRLESGLLCASHPNILQSLSNFRSTLYNCHAQTNINRMCVRVGLHLTCRETQRMCLE